jgi:hypothetical protein
MNAAGAHLEGILFSPMSTTARLPLKLPSTVPQFMVEKLMLDAGLPDFYWHNTYTKMATKLPMVIYI